MTTNLAFRRFYSERWWERKASTYSEALDALFERQDAAANLYLMLSPEHPDVDDENAEKEWERYKRALDHMGRVLYVGALTLSDEAMEILADYRRESRNIVGHVNSVDFLLADSASTARALDRFREEAKRDLQVDRALR